MSSASIEGKFCAPEFDCKSIGGWAFCHSVRTVWRVAPLYDVEDLMSEARMSYLICVRRYEHRCKNMAHFSTLFRRIFTNRVHRLANERTVKHLRDGYAATDLLPDDDFFSYRAGHSDTSALSDLMLDLQGAPEEVLAFLRAALTGAGAAAADAVETVRGRRRVNRLLCKLAGAPKDTDLVGALVERLAGKKEFAAAV